MGVPTYGAIILDETLENVSVIKRKIFSEKNKIFINVWNWFFKKYIRFLVLEGQILQILSAFCLNILYLLQYGLLQRSALSLLKYFKMGRMPFFTLVVYPESWEIIKSKYCIKLLVITVTWRKEKNTFAFRKERGKARQVLFLSLLVL